MWRAHLLLLVLLAWTPHAIAKYWQCDSHFTLAGKTYYGNCRRVTCPPCPPCAPCSNGTCGVCDTVKCPECPECVCPEPPPCPKCPSCPTTRGPWIGNTNHYYGFTAFQVVTALLVAVVFIAAVTAGLVWLRMRSLLQSQHVVQLQPVLGLSSTPPVTPRAPRPVQHSTPYVQAGPPPLPLPPLMASNLRPGFCQKITGTGRQCTRQPEADSDYCWQHK